MSSSSSSSSLCLLLFSSFLLLSSFPHLPHAQPIVKGLSWTFYKSTCPKLESIVRKELTKIIRQDIGQAAGLLRLHFHDCFVQGCEGSVLLNGSEQTAPPNLSLRKESLRAINDVREIVHRACGQIVSCSDILALAARDSVFLSGGPDYKVPLGRRDSLTFATEDETNRNLPFFGSNVTVLLGDFAAKNLDINDLVALSGGHTVGIGHCPAFTGRLYPTQDPIMDKTYANRLKAVCPAPDTNASTVFDLRSPNLFDNKYFVNLMNRQGLLTSDQDLYTDPRTRPIVTSYAVDQPLFFEQFKLSMIKMSQLSVLTGGQGEIRANCAVRNSGRSSAEESLGSMVAGEGAESGSAAF